VRALAARSVADVDVSHLLNSSRQTCYSRSIYL
jgi:hypothetical protein